MFLKMRFLKKQVTSVKITRKGALFLPETYLNHRKHILTPSLKLKHQKYTR